VRLRQYIALAAGARPFRKIADRFVRRGQAGRAQEQARRKTLDGAADDAMGVLRLDLAVDVDAQLRQGASGAEHVGDVAEGVFMGRKARIRRYVDAPAHDMLAVEIARGHPQELNRACRRRTVTIDRTVVDSHVHGVEDFGGVQRVSA
jgi:hypothetical protein